MTNLERAARRMEVRWRTVVAVVAGFVCIASVAGFYAGNGNGSESDARAPTTTSAPGISGFGTISIRIGRGTTTTERCVLLAETPDQLSRGLMNRDDLGGFPGMLFRFTTDSNAQFYMANVQIPLSIAWFDGNGRFVSSADMTPCEVQPNDCPRYPATGPYRYAIETVQGELDDLGLTADSTIQLAGACTSS